MTLAERLEVSFAREVDSLLDAVALVLDGIALERGWEKESEKGLEDTCWKRGYTASEKRIDTAVVRQEGHAVVLGTAKERDMCAYWEVPLDTCFGDTAALPLTSGAVQRWLKSEPRLVQGLSDLLDEITAEVHEEKEAKDVQTARAPRASPRMTHDTDAPPHPPPTSNPLQIGDADRDPLAASGHRPFMGGFAPPPVFGPRGDGMLVGPGHPMFHAPPRPPPRGPWGGDGFLPPGAVPPGARFDPVGPFGRPPPPPGAFRGNPDWDDLPPPGGPGSMYL